MSAYEQRYSRSDILRCMSCGTNIEAGSGSEYAIAKLMKSHDAVCKAEPAKLRTQMWTKQVAGGSVMAEVTTDGKTVTLDYTLFADIMRELGFTKRG